MWVDIVNIAVGLVVGLATGFYFDRRATRAARAQNRELEEELAALRTSVYSVGGDVPPKEQAHPVPVSVLDDVFSRARAIQDPDGRLSRTLLTSHFFAQGLRARDVDKAIQELCKAGKAREDGKWLEVL